MPTDPILEAPIRTLKLSRQLKRALNTNNIKNMKALLPYQTKDTQNWSGMNIQLVHEYVNYLIENGYGHLIDHKPL